MAFEKEYIVWCSFAELIVRKRMLPWDDAIVVWAGKLRKLCDFPEWTAQFSGWKTIGKTVPRTVLLHCQNCAVYSVFSPSGTTPHSKIAQINWECVAPWTRLAQNGRLTPVKNCVEPYSWFRNKLNSAVSPFVFCCGFMDEEEETTSWCVVDRAS